MNEAVLEDVKADYKLVSNSYDAVGALGAIKGLILKYMTSGQMSYAEGVRVVCCMLLILTSYKEKDNGAQR